MNNHLKLAKARKDDEFFTRMEDIRAELGQYTKHFRDKIVLCNCDDTSTSNFVKYFLENFEGLGLRRLIASCYKNRRFDLLRPLPKRAFFAEFSSGDAKMIPRLHSGDGDFRSGEVIDLLRTADIVVSNPPFSLFREYFEQLIKYDKKFLIVGPISAFTYKCVFPFIKAGSVWCGVNQVRRFNLPGGEIINLGNCCWITNLTSTANPYMHFLTKRYHKAEYKEYENYAAIEVSRVVDIPMDYPGAMGVPVSYMLKHNPEQFELIGTDHGSGSGLSGGLWKGWGSRCVLGGREVYRRVFIRNKNPIITSKKSTHICTF